MSLYGWDNDFNQMERSVNRLFDNLIKDLSVARRNDGSVSRSGRRQWSPSIDVYENEKEFVVHAELPGIAKEQVNVDVRDSALIISGETKQDQKHQEGNTHIQERRYGSFTRAISLPQNAKIDDISAKFNQGLLEVTIPKGEFSSGRKITVE